MVDFTLYPDELVATAVAGGKSVKLPRFAVLPTVAAWLERSDPALFPFAAVARNPSDLKKFGIDERITHVVIAYVLTTSIDHAESSVRYLMQKRAVILRFYFPQIAEVLRGRLQSSAVFVCTDAIARSPKFLSFYSKTVDHQRTTTEADLVDDGHEPLAQYEPLGAFVPRTDRCLTSGCRCIDVTPRKRAPVAVLRAQRQLLCNICGHVAGDRLACMLCGCGTCCTCLAQITGDRKCNCDKRSDLLRADLTGSTIALQFCIGSAVCRSKTSVKYEGHLVGSESDKLYIVLSPVPVFSSVLPLLDAPGFLPSIRTGCVDMAAFAAFPRLGPALGKDATLAECLHTLQTLSIVCGSMLAVGGILPSISIGDFVVEPLSGNRCAVYLLPAISSLVPLRSTLADPLKQEWTRLVHELLEMTAKAGGASLSTEFRLELIKCIHATALVPGSCSSALGGESFSAAKLEPSSSLGTPEWRSRSLAKCFLVVLMFHISAILNQRLFADGDKSACTWMAMFPMTSI